MLPRPLPLRQTDLYTLTTWTVFGRPPSGTGSEGHTEGSNERTDWSGSPAVRPQSAPRSGTTVSRNTRVNNKHKSQAQIWINKVFLHDMYNI